MGDELADSNFKEIVLWLLRLRRRFRVTGASMFPLLSEGDEVLIDPLSSNTDAIRFYQRLGFRFLERRWFGDDLTDVHVLSRSKWADSK